MDVTCRRGHVAAGDRRSQAGGRHGRQYDIPPAAKAVGNMGATKGGHVEDGGMQCHVDNAAAQGHQDRVQAEPRRYSFGSRGTGTPRAQSRPPIDYPDVACSRASIGGPVKPCHSRNFGSAGAVDDYATLRGANRTGGRSSSRERNMRRAAKMRWGIRHSQAGAGAADGGAAPHLQPRPPAVRGGLADRMDEYAQRRGDNAVASMPSRLGTGRADVCLEVGGRVR